MVVELMRPACSAFNPEESALWLLDSHSLVLPPVYPTQEFTIERLNLSLAFRMSAIASKDERWYFVPPQICFREYALHASQKKLHQKVLARSRQHFQTASVELTAFSLDCFSISGSSCLKNAGPDSTFVFTVSFDIPPPEGLLLESEFHSNFQDQVHIRDSVSGAIFATLVVKAIWDLTSDNIAVFHPSMLPSVSSSPPPHFVDTAALQPRTLAGTSKQLSSAIDHVDGLLRPKYDEAEDSFYRSLLAGSAATFPRDTPVSTRISAPKDSRIQLSIDDAAFYSSVIAGRKEVPGIEDIKQQKPTKSVVHFEGDEIIIIDGIKYDTWGNMISSMTDCNQQLIQDAVEVLAFHEALTAKKKLPHLGPTTVRGSNVPAKKTPQAISGDNRYLEILDGNVIPETQNACQVRGRSIKQPGKVIGGSISQVSVFPSHVAVACTNSAIVSTVSSHYQRPILPSAQKKQSKKCAPQLATFSPVKTEDQLSDAWDAL